MRSKSSIKALWILALITPFVILIFLVHAYGTNVPFGDQWELVPLIQKLKMGSLSLHDLWQQHNEHRLIFPRLLMLGLASVSRWNILYELYANLVLAFLIFLVLRAILKQTFGPKPSFYVLSIACAWLVFSTDQWENWLWGWQLQWFMNVLALLVSLWAISFWPRDRSQWQGLAIGIAGATVGTYSLASGAFIWVVGFAALLTRKEMRRYWPIWTLSALAVMATYITGYKKPGGHPPLNSALRDPFGFLEYVLIYLGRPLSPHLRIAMAIGAASAFLLVISGLYLGLRKKELLKESFVWFGLAIYVILTAALSGVARLGFGKAQAGSSRYTTISLLFTLSVVVVISIAVKAHRENYGRLEAWKVGILILGAALTLGLYISSYQEGLNGLKSRHGLMVQTKQCLDSAQSQTDSCLLATYPPTSVVPWERSHYLRQIGWGGFTKN